MRELDDDAMIAALRDLGRRIDVGTAADQRAAVRARLLDPAPDAAGAGPGAGPGAVRRRWRRWCAAVAAAVVGTVLVVPPARAAVVDTVDDLLRVAGVRVRTDAGPRVLPSSPAPLPSTRDVGLAEARRVAPFVVGVPAALGEPDRVTVADLDGGGKPRVVTLVYAGGAVRLDEFDAGAENGFLKWAADGERADVGDQPGIWFAAPHPLVYFDRSGVTHTEGTRLAGPSLVWASATVTFRLEGVATLAEARAIAASVR